MRCIMSGFGMRRRLARRGPGFQAAIAAVLLCAVQAGAQNDGPTKWTNTNGGVWSDSTGWSNSVPSNNNAYITAIGASYTVTYDTPTNYFRDLTISNSAGYISTLTITSTAFAPIGNILLASGAVVNVNSGGVWSPVLGTNVSLDIKAGAVLNIAGGAILYTNAPLTNDVSLKLNDSSAGATSVLNLTSGQLELRTTNATTYSWEPLKIGSSKSGIMNISGGKCVIETCGHNSSVIIGNNAGGRGYLNISGGELVITNAPGGPYLGPYTELGYLGGGYGEINISGDGKFTKANNKEFWIGQSGDGRFNMNGGTASLYGTFLVGCRGINGTGIVEITAGDLLVRSVAYLGAEDYSGNKDETGILNVYGGTVTLEAGIYAGRSYTWGLTNRIGRITVTNGLLITKSPGIYVGLVGHVPGKASGEVNLSGSGVISNWGNLYVAYGTGAVGVVNQTGGTFEQNYNSTVTYIGENGGNGTFNMSGGLLKNKYTAYVGGSIGSNSVGALNISGGTFQLYAQPLSIGEKGTGTLNMAGSQGTLNGSALTATTSTSRIKFDLGPNGAGTVTISGAVSIGTNANLEITVTSYDFLANGLNVDLISYGTLTGTFGTNVTLIGAAGRLDGGAVTYGSGTSDKIRLQLRPAVGTIFYMR